MNDALTREIKVKVRDEILEVLRKNNLPAGEHMRDAVWALMKEVSCHHQNGTK